MLCFDALSSGALVIRFARRPALGAFTGPHNPPWRLIAFSGFAARTTAPRRGLPGPPRSVPAEGTDLSVGNYL